MQNNLDVLDLLPLSHFYSPESRGSGYSSSFSGGVGESCSCFMLQLYSVNLCWGHCIRYSLSFFQSNFRIFYFIFSHSYIKIRKSIVIIKKSNLRVQCKYLFWGFLRSKKYLLQNGRLYVCRKRWREKLPDRFPPNSQQTYHLSIPIQMYEKGF